MRRKVIIDTSPLIIHMVGTYDKKLIDKVSIYNLPNDEWICIDKLISDAVVIFITPYVLAELFWLTKTRLRPAKETIKVVLNYREMILKFQEIFIKKSEILNFKNLEFGPTDVSLFLAAKKLKYPILTSDSRFISYCKGKGLDIIDFADPLFNLY